MPTKIRLARHGKKSRPYYFIVVADSRAPRDGKFIARIGSYNPVTNPATIEIDFDQALSWLQKGALPTDTVRSLLHEKGILYKNHLLKGVKKGAFTEEQAELKFQEWMTANESKLKSTISKIDAEKRNDTKSRLAAESKVKEARAAALAKKNAKEAAAAAEEEAAPAAEEEAAPATEEEAAPAAEEEAAPAVEEEAAPAVEEEAAPAVEEEAVPEAEAETAEETPAAE